MRRALPFIYQFASYESRSVLWHNSGYLYPILTTLKAKPAVYTQIQMSRKMGNSQTSSTGLPESNSIERSDKVRLTEDEWRKKLTSEQFQVCRRKGTERAWTGDLLDNKKKGYYICTACGTDLFSSSTKFDSGSGWPSFFDVVRDKTTNVSNVEVLTDSSHGMTRTEVLCGKCDSHLGHVFNDGPQPTGLRFCINSISIGFREEPSSSM